MAKDAESTTESDHLAQLKQELNQAKEQLIERNKELNCHNQISNWVIDENISFDNFLQKVVDLLPLSFHYPNRTHAKLVFNEKKYVSKDFIETDFYLIEEIIFKDVKYGQISMFISQINTTDSIDFLKEESSLLKTVALRVAKYYNIQLKNQKLENSNARYSYIINNLKEAIIETDQYGTIQFIGPAIKNILEFEPKELLNISLEKLIIKEENPSAKLFDKIETNSIRVIQVISKSGELKWLSYSFQTSADGNRITGTISDITKQKELIDRLEISETRYKSMFFNSPEAHLIIENGVFVEVNNMVEELIGYTREEIIGKQPHEISPLNQPNGKNSESYAEELINDVLKKGRSAFEWQHLKKNGEILLVKVHFNTWNIDDKMIIFTSWRDITKQKRTEVELQKLYQAVEQSPLSLVITDLDGNIEYTNPATSRKTGYSKDELAGHNPRILQSGFTSKQEYAKIWETIINGHVWKGTFLNKKKNGEEFWESSVIAPIKNKNGQIINFIAIKEDITEKKKLDEELLKFRAIADNANIGMAINELDGTFIYVNKAWASMHGYEPEELIGQNIKIGHNEDQLKKVDPLIAKLMESGRLYPIELDHITKDDIIFPTLTSANVIYDTKNNPLYLSTNCIDISELKTAHQLLQTQHNRLITLVQSVPDNIFLINNENIFTDYAQHQNNPLQNITALQISDIIDPKNHDLFLSKLNKCRKEQQPIVFESNKVEADQVKYFETRLIPLVEGEILAIIRNISYRIFARNEIIKLSLAIEQSPVMVVITDTNANIEYVNQAFETITGYEKDNILGKNTRILNSGKNSTELYKDLWDTIKKGQNWESEWINKKKDGSLYWEKASINPIFNEHQEIINFLAIKQDISEQKANEKRIQELNNNLEQKVIERTQELQTANQLLINEIKERKITEEKFAIAFQAGSALMTMNYADTMEFIDVNKSYTETLGYTREDVFSGYLAQRLMEENDPTINQVFEELARQQSVSKREIRIPLKNGGYKDVLYSSDLIYLNNRPVNLSVAVDISDLKKAELELIKARKDAEKSNKAKSEFLANMSHEIRTPMNAVLGYASLLGKQVKEPKQAQFLENIQSSGQSLLRIINDILDLSKIESGKLELEYQYVNTRKFFSEFTKLFSFKTMEKGIEFITQIDPKLPESMQIDETRLRQVLINIIGNAVKFTHKGQVVLSVDVDKLAKSASKNTINLRLSIKDTGIGIPDHMQNEIFESFVQVSGSQNPGGTGLGLPISNRLVKMMGGKVSLHSIPGEGSTFEVIIPNIKIAKENFSDIKSTDYAHYSWKFDGSNILVVDDISLNIDFIADILSDTNLNILRAKNGQEALNILHDHDVKLIITDIRMPVMDGYELLIAIRNNNKLKQLPVLAYSASVLKEQEEEIKGSAFSAFLSKPLEIDELLETLSKFLEHEKVIEHQGFIKNEKSIPIHDIIDSKGLLKELTTLLSVQHQVLLKRQAIEDVISFSANLVETGKKHRVDVLIELGMELKESADQFNVAKIIKDIDQFGKIKDGLIKELGNG